MPSISIVLLLRLLPYCIAAQKLRSMTGKIESCFYPVEVSEKRMVDAGDNFKTRSDCENFCNERICEAYVYSAQKCVLLGRVIGAPCKCEICKRQECKTSTTVSTTPQPANSCHIGPLPDPTDSTWQPFYPMCVKPDGLTFANPDPSKFMCNANACRCKGKAIMYFSSAAKGDYFPFIGMDAEGLWLGFSAYAWGRERAKIESISCLDYTPPSHQLCGDLYSLGGQQDADLPCGKDAVMLGWRAGDKDSYTLSCTPQGWTSDGIVVRPEHVFCTAQ